MQFLDDTKRGHCSLYASAMTLILRELGIPARYCTGFYVEGENGGGSVLLREKNLHAWVEVYLGEYGWVNIRPPQVLPHIPEGLYRIQQPSLTSPEVSPARTRESRPEPAKPEEKSRRDPLRRPHLRRTFAPAPVSSEEPAELAQFKDCFLLRLHLLEPRLSL